MQPSHELNDNKTTSFEHIDPTTLLDNYDLSEQPTPTEENTSTPTEENTSTPTEENTPTPTEEHTSTPTEEHTSTPTEEHTSTPTDDITQQTTSTTSTTSTQDDTTQEIVTPSPQVNSFDFGQLLQAYQSDIANYQQSIIMMNDAISLVSGMTNFDTIKNATLSAYSSSIENFEENIANSGVIIQNIVNIQNLNQDQIDDLYSLFTYVGNMERFLKVLSINYADILADNNFINLMSDTTNSQNNKKIVAQYIYQAYSQ